MIVALSRFMIANDMSTEVREAFRQRPHLVDNASDFLGIEVMSPLDKPAEICLSVSFAQQIPVVKAAIAQFDARLGSARPAVIVMIGGLAINRFEPLAGVAGADTYSADAQTAVVDANRIFGALGRMGSITPELASLLAVAAAGLVKPGCAPSLTRSVLPGGSCSRRSIRITRGRPVAAPRGAGSGNRHQRAGAWQHLQDKCLADAGIRLHQPGHTGRVDCTGAAGNSGWAANT